MERAKRPLAMIATITIKMIVPTTINDISPASRPVDVAGGVVVDVVVTGVVVAVVVAGLVVVVGGVVVAGGGPKTRNVPPVPAVKILLAEVPQNDKRFLAVPLVMALHEVPSK